ncbi:MAG TPA: hydantoinase/oxoprolinase family protein, partial [Myxococcales bacterium]|nr:hydantoinase/oxoprolinase family protein [Myxococcales bacterium]
MRAIGVDVGGTFTDLALWDDRRSALAVFKLPSVPHDPALGILDGLRTLAAREGVEPATLTFVAHGTTVATNALLEGKGARTGLVTTRGFRDLLEIARQKRPHLYDLQADKPAPLIPRFLRWEVGERLAWDGSVVEKLSLDEVRDALDALRAEDVEALAVCFLYSFVDPTHERLVEAEISARCRGVFVSLSADVSPEFREYERLSTTVINAYLGPLVGRYLQRFGDEIARLGIRQPPYVNQSNGGIISVAAASSQP